MTGLGGSGNHRSLRDARWADEGRRALTLLFTDVVGSTELVGRLGDAQWRPRLRRHTAFVCTTIADGGGRVIDVTGDGVFAIFPSTSQALRTAAVLAQQCPVQGGEMPVRVGVHSGEVEVEADNVSGVSVHAAARVMSVADAGDVAVSRAAVDQVRGAGFAFDGPTSHVLKGLDGEWELYRLDLTTLPQTQNLPAAAVPSARTAAPRLLRPLALSVAGTLVAAATVGVVVLRPADRGDAGAARPFRPGPQAQVTDAFVDAAWSTARPLGLPRQQAQAVALAGSIVVAGGLVEGGATDSVESYDPAIDVWQRLTPLPLPLHHAMTASWNGRACVLGGWSPQGARLTATTSDRVLLLGPDGWRDLPPLRSPRAAGGAATVGDRLVVVGGQSAAGELLDSVEVFDGQTWRAGAPLPVPRDHLSVVSDGRYVYAIGGRALSSSANLAAVDRYDPATDRWTALPALPVADGGIAGAVLDGRLVITGGEGPDGVHTGTRVLDPGSTQWLAAPDLPRARHGAAAAALGGAMYVIGGALSPTHVASTGDVAVLSVG